MSGKTITFAAIIVDKFVMIATTEKNAKAIFLFSLCFSNHFATFFV